MRFGEKYELVGRSRGRTDGRELRVGVEDVGLVEERDEGLVRRLDHHELKRVAVEGDALEGLEDRAECCPAGN